jgi:hypothetical protein
LNAWWLAWMATLLTFPDRPSLNESNITEGTPKYSI